MGSLSTSDLAAIPERIQLEVERAIQRSIKGVEYFSTSGPGLGRRSASCARDGTPPPVAHNKPMGSW